MSEISSVRVAIVEDNAELRAAFRELVDGVTDFDCVADLGTAEEAVRVLPALAPDVVLMDINLPGMDGVQCIGALRAQGLGSQIVMLTAFEEPETIFESMKAGATGYVLKRARAWEIVDAVRQVHDGGAPMTGSVARRIVEHFSRPVAQDAEIESLTAREREVLERLAEGMLHKQIAESLDISVNTVRKHLRSIYDKLHVTTRTRAVSRFLQR